MSQVNTSAADAQEPSTGKLVKQMTGQVSTLRRDELKPAQVEMTRKGRQAGLGVGMLAGIAALMGKGRIHRAVRGPDGNGRQRENRRGRDQGRGRR